MSTRVLVGKWDVCLEQCKLPSGVEHALFPVGSCMLARRYDSCGRRRKPHVRFIVADSKLQEEFIRRFIGQLTALEESRLCELKYWLLDHHKGKVGVRFVIDLNEVTFQLPNDAHLLRFLRARDF